jgi:hypothetical protein
MAKNAKRNSAFAPRRSRETPRAQAPLQARAHCPSVVASLAHDVRRPHTTHPSACAPRPAARARPTRPRLHLRLRLPAPRARGASPRWQPTRVRHTRERGWMRLRLLCVCVAGLSAAAARADEETTAVIARLLQEDAMQARYAPQRRLAQRATAVCSRRAALLLSTAQAAALMRHYSPERPETGSSDDDVRALRVLRAHAQTQMQTRVLKRDERCGAARRTTRQLAPPPSAARPRRPSQVRTASRRRRQALRTPHTFLPLF